MADAELTATLKLKSDEFERNVKSSTEAAEELAKRVGDSTDSLNDQQKALLKSAKDAGYYFDAQGRLHDQTGKYAKQNDELGQKLKALQAELKRTGKEAEILETGLHKAGNASQKIDVGGKGSSFKVGAMAGVVGGAVGGVIGGVVSGVTSAIVSNAQQIIVSGIQRINAEAAKAATVLIDSSRLNVDTRTLQEWTYAAGKMNINADKMGDIFKDTNDKIGDFVRTGGGEAKDIIDTLNINVRELIGLSPDKVLMRIAKESEGLNAQDRTFLFEAIADEASALLPLLDDGAAKMQAFKDQAQREGRILSDGQLQAMKSYKESLDSLISRAEAFAAQVAGNLAKPLEILTNEFNKLIDQYGGAEKAAKSFAVTVVDGTAMGIQALATLYEYISKTRVVFNALVGMNAEHQLGKAERGYEVAQAGYKGGWTSKEELEKAKKNYEMAKESSDAAMNATIDASKAAEEAKKLATDIKDIAKTFKEEGTKAIQNEEKPKTVGELGADAFRAKQEYEALEAQKADGAKILEAHTKMLLLEAQVAEAQNKPTDRSLSDYDKQAASAKAEGDAKAAKKTEEEKSKELDKRNKELLKEQQDQLKWKQKMDMDDAKSKDATTKEQSAATQAFNESVRSFGQSVDKQNNGKVVDANGKEVPQIQAFYGSGGGRPAAVQPQQQFNSTGGSMDNSQNMGTVNISVASKDGVVKMFPVLGNVKTLQELKTAVESIMNQYAANGQAANS